MNKLFGTDGIRGRAGVDLTPELALRAAYGFASHLVALKSRYGQSGRPQFAVGCDPRLSSPMLSRAVMAGLTFAGADVLDLHIVPTPVVPLLLLKHGCAGGVMITASHNPVEDNGLKFFGPDGMKVAARTERAIEAAVHGGAQQVDNQTGFGAVISAQSEEEYLTHLARSLKLKPGRGSLKVVLDCAHGATAHLAPRAFAALGFEVTALHDTFDGTRINVRCGATDLKELSRTVVQRGAELGLAFDGDGDRVLAVDHTGAAVSGDRIIALLATRIKAYQADAAVVMTQMTNLGVEQAPQRQGVRLLRTDVGDIKVMAALHRHGLKLGGEQSGHIIMLDVLPSGDGIAAGLRVAGLVRASGKSLRELTAPFTEFPQQLTNLKVRDKHSWKDNPELRHNLAKVRSSYKSVRFYLRPSGTENLIRVLTEAEDAELCRRSNEAACEVLLNWDQG